MFKQLSLLLLSIASIAPLQAKMSPMTAWTFNRANACLNPNNVNHVSANGECLALQTYTGKHQTAQHPILLVFIHGDGIPGGGPSDYLKYQATKFVNKHIVSVVMIRPGYYDSYGHYSTGESHAFDCQGYPCDGYRPKTVNTLAAAIYQLKNYYQPRATILIGHSGGAMMSAIMLGKFPHIANGAVLVSMVPTVHAWANKHGWGTWPNSLSPNQFEKSIPKSTIIKIISGDNDTNTYPAMTKQYQENLKILGINSQLISVPHGTHNSVALTQTVAMDRAIKSLLNHFNR